MSADLVVYFLRGNKRSQIIGEALAAGAKRVGYSVVAHFDNAFRKPHERMAAFYGYGKEHPRIMRSFREHGKRVVFVDLGYWGRRHGGRYGGYHKVAINDRHPTHLFQRVQHDDKRLARFGIKPRLWREDGKHIVLAGMSAKSAESYGYGPMEWEQWALNEIRKHTDRPVIYRPKPSWKEAKPIRGASYCDPERPLAIALRRAFAVVTHHSNVAIDALVDGVPAFCWDGVAVPMSRQDLSLIEDPLYPDGRWQWMCDIAYWQWSVEEMRSGAMWRHLQAEAVI